MLHVYLLLLLGVGISQAAKLEDFDILYDFYDLVYHGSTHLLVAIDRDHCYYVHVPEDREGNLVDDSQGFAAGRLQRTEHSLIEHISRHHSVTQTTLDAVRDKYGDLLADFHCLDKYIYEVDIFSTNGGAGQHTTNAPVNHDIFTCLGQADGPYVYAADCNKYLNCHQHSMSIMQCPPGTQFDPTLQDCVQRHLC